VIAEINGSAASGPNFTRKTSLPPALTNVPPPKFPVTPKLPVTNTWFVASTATLRPDSPAMSPDCQLHTCVPAEVNLAMKISPLPAVTNVSPPKFTVPVKLPVTMMSPNASTRAA
jgi:hypothetical protein